MSEEIVIRKWHDYWICVSCKGRKVVQSPSEGEPDGPKRCYRCGGTGITFSSSFLDKLIADMKKDNPNWYT